MEECKLVDASSLQMQNILQNVNSYDDLILFSNCKEQF